MCVPTKQLVVVAAIFSVPSSIASTVSSTVVGALDQLDSGANVSQVLEDSAADLVSENIESKIRERLTNTEVSIDLSPDGDNTIGVLTVQPLSDPEDVTNTLFGQGSLFSSDNRHTVNVGLGYRRLSQDQNWLYGVNGFYDHEFPYDHSRASVGLELRSSAIEFTANEYFALSGWRAGENSVDEHALDGRDFEVGFAIPYMPSSRIYHRQFQWDALDGAADLEGHTTSVEISGDVLTPGLNFSIGSTMFDGDRDDITFVRLEYQFGKAASQTNPLISENAFQFESMIGKRFEKVRRENQIIKQTRSKVVFRGK